MSGIIFLGCKKTKDSYEDLYKMALLSDFKIQLKDNEGPEDAHYIACSHSDVEPGPNRKVVFWYLERPYTYGGVESLRERFKSFLESGKYLSIWVSDRKLEQELKGLAKFVPVGCHPDLIKPNVHKDYDIVHMSYETPRRKEVYQKIRGSIAPNSYGENKYELIAKSKFLLNTHQSDDKYIEPLRICLAVAAGIPIISEDSYDAYPYKKDGSFLEFSIEEISDATNNILKKEYAPFLDNALELREEVIKNYKFDNNIIKALGI
jgi:hypothetical protein